MRNLFRPAQPTAKEIAAERIAAMIGRYTRKPTTSNKMRYVALAAGAALLYASYRQRSNHH